MNKNKFLLALLSTSLLISSDLIAKSIDHKNMDHSKHLIKMDEPANPINSTSNNLNSNQPQLKESGNAIFGTIQEVLKKLNADPNTDWKKVNIEGLRQHLIDMENFTSGVDIISQKNIEKGVEIIVQAKFEAAHHSLSRALEAHPSMMKSETGWTMNIKQNRNRFTLIIETNEPEEVPKLRALGYIGIMAQGDHHQTHHWLMATGSNPHHGEMNH